MCDSVGSIMGFIVDWLLWSRSTLVWKGLPSLVNNDAYFVFWITGAPRENGRLRNFKAFFCPFSVFLSFGKSYFLPQVLGKDTAVSLDWSGEGLHRTILMLRFLMLVVFFLVVTMFLTPMLISLLWLNIGWCLRGLGVKVRGLCKLVLAQFGLLLA